MKPTHSDAAAMPGIPHPTPISLDALHLKLQHLAAKVDHQKSKSSKQAGELEQVRYTLGNATQMNTALAAEIVLLREEHR